MVKKRFCILSVVALLCLIPLFSPSTSNATTTYSATIEYVVDGDTVNLQNEILGTDKVRLLSIDAPETRYYNHAQSPWGEQSKEFLQKILPPGTKITIKTDREEKDKYGRLLAYIWKGKLDVNKEMLKEGHAVSYYIYPNQLYFSEYQQTMVEARLAGKGIWNDSNPLKELPFEFRQRISKRSSEKFVGDFNTKIYVSPSNYTNIPIQKRIFFFKESDARNAEYTKADEALELEPCS